MKSYLLIIGVFVSIAIIEADDAKEVAAPVDATPDISSPAKICTCDKPCTCQKPKTKYECYDVDDLLKYCPPCPMTCSTQCPCKFSNEDPTIITSKKVGERPIFCPECIMKVKCLIRVCIAEPQLCTAETIQQWINAK